MNLLDIIGPVMIGPSSSHTAGAVRIGRVGWKLLGARATKAEIGLAGSFATTYRGHGTDKALLAGILGMKPDDERIPRSMEIAREQGLEYTFCEIRLPRAHPNTAVLNLFGEHGATCSLQGASIGGGSVLITRLNGMEAAFGGQQDTLLIPYTDTPGVIASVAALVADSGVNIGNFRSNRPQRGQQATMTIELDAPVDREVIEQLKLLPGVINVVYMHAN